MSSDILRTFAIDIETDSTISADEARDKQDVIEFMGAMGQMMQAAEPLAAQMGPEPVRAIMLAGLRRFRFGREVEDMIKNAKPPPKGPSFAEQLEAKDLERRTQADKMREQNKASEIQGKNQLAQGQVVELTSRAVRTMKEALDDDDNAAD